MNFKCTYQPINKCQVFIKFNGKRSLSYDIKKIVGKESFEKGNVHLKHLLRRIITCTRSKVIVNGQGTQVHTKKEPNIQQSLYDLCKFKNNIMER